MTNASPTRARDPLSKSEIEALVREIAALSDPKSARSKGLGKDMRATRALSLAGTLVDGLAGWAIAHQVGLAVNDVQFDQLDLTAVPNSGAADEGHEADGDNYDWSNPTTNRRALVNLLAANSGAFPYALVLEAALSLEALDLDQINPILESRRRALNEGPYMLSQLRLRAIEHVMFYSEAGAGREEAEAKVAEAYGVSVDTLSEWRNRLPYLLGPRGVHDSYQRAGAAGGTAHRLGPPLCRVEVRKRDEQLGSDATRHEVVQRDLRSLAER